jgi:hypothetical protein
MAALVLTLLTLGPSLDDLFCRDQDSFRVMAAEMSVEKVASVSAAPISDSDGFGVCFYGPCHHVAPFGPAAPSEVSAPDYMSQIVRRPADERVVASAPQFGLLRPPRA